MKNTFLFVVILLFLFGSFTPTIVGIKNEKTTYQTIGSSGYIQNLIDNANEGDTIYIPSGTYYENIIIDKSINLVGEDKETTIIDGGGEVNVVYIPADWVNISGFTIQTGRGYGIETDSDYNTINNNILNENHVGIGLGGNSNYNNIINNIMTSNDGYDISLGSSDHNRIINNTMTSKNDNGIALHLSNYNIIIGNIISNKKRGISLGGSSFNNITGNTISKNTYGIYLRFLTIFGGRQLSKKNSFSKNNFLGFGQHVYCGGDWSNKWNENYWKRPRSLPKVIFGFRFVGFYGFASVPIAIPWINFDLHPAKEPYGIGG